MEPENLNEVTEETVEASQLHKVTPLSKYLAMALFIILPFIGAWIGYNYAPEKVVEVEKRVISDTSELSEVGSSPSKSDVEEDVVHEERGPSRDYDKEKTEVVPVDLIGVNKTETEEIFSLAEKEVGTSVYYNELLGVGWTYHSQSSMPDTEFSFSQTGNVISLRYVFDETNRKSPESVHVFAKDPTSDIAETIKNQFLIEYESVCMVEEKNGYSGFDSDHREFYLRNTSGNTGCPGGTISGPLRSFIYNPNVPDKFVLVEGGSDPFVRDGSPGKNNRHWFESVRIVE
jgi:hypothetical protein